MKKARTPTPIEDCTQNSKLSTSPGSSCPSIFSKIGSAIGWKEESTSSTTWLPASSDPPNSASFKAINGKKAINKIITVAVFLK